MRADLSPLSLMTVNSAFESLLVESDVSDVSESASGWSDAGLVVRHWEVGRCEHWQRCRTNSQPRCSSRRTSGTNADAFDECIADLAWLPAQGGYVIVVLESAELLADESVALRWLAGSLSRACEQWATPVDDGEWWDSPAVPFHVVLHAAPGNGDATAERWAHVGVHVASFIT